MTHLHQIFCNDRVRSLVGILARLHSAEGTVESAGAGQAN